MGAIREQATKQDGILALYNADHTAVDTSPAIDTAAFEDGISFVMAVSGMPDTAVKTMTFTECDTFGGDYTAVDASNLVYGRKGTAVNITNSSGGAAGGEGSACAHEGLVGTKRYVKVVVTPTVATGGVLMVFAIRTSELIPIESGSVTFTP